MKGTATGGNKAERCRQMHPQTVLTAVNCVPRGFSLAFIITGKLVSVIGAEL